MIGQGKSGRWVAGICAALVLISIGFAWGKRSRSPLASSGEVAPAGAPLPVIQIEPIQPQEELAAISASPNAFTGAAVAALPSPEASASAAATTAAATGSSMEESARVRQIQLALRAAGFDPGSADGKMGPRTKTAVRDFQRAQGLEPDGKVGPKTWSKLEAYLRQETASQ